MMIESFCNEFSYNAHMQGILKEYLLCPMQWIVIHIGGLHECVGVHKLPVHYFNE